MQAEHERTAGLSGLEGGEAKSTGFDGDLANRLGGFGRRGQPTDCQKSSRRRL